MTARFRGEHLLENAARFLAGTQHLSQDDRYSHEILIHFSACAIELSLKAFLQFRGWSDDRCRLKIRHDLIKALDAAERLGFYPSYSHLRPFLAILSPAYCRHRICDLATCEPPLLSPQQVLRAAEEILRDVRTACSKGFGLGGRSSGRPREEED